MTENTAQQEQFTGLILLTGIDKPGISASLFETLAPFAVHILDIEQIVINHRLILTVLIGANPAHQTAIEEDLAACASALDVDIATVFAKSSLTDVPKNLVEIHISSVKLHPRTIALVTKAVTDSGANIERFVRESTNPTSICITVSGSAAEQISAALANLPIEDATTTVNAL
jgi:phosphoserine phosphatase